MTSPRKSQGCQSFISNLLLDDIFSRTYFCFYGFVTCVKILSGFEWTLKSSKEPSPVPERCVDDPAITKEGPRTNLTTEYFVQKPASLKSFVTHYNSSPDIWRTFCKRSGTNLTYVCTKVRGLDTASMVDPILGILDQEGLKLPGVRPDRHLFWFAGIEWIQKVTVI
jgi:hypothetical protein